MRTIVINWAEAVAAEQAAQQAAGHDAVQQTRRIMAARWRAGQARRQQQARQQQETPMPRKKISPALARDAGRAISAAVQRGALESEGRVEHWAQQVLSAGSDDAAREVIATIDTLHGPHGPGRSGEDEVALEADATALYPPRPGKEREWQAARLAASQASAAAEDEDFSGLFPPGSPGEAGEQQRIAASNPPRQPPGDDDGEDEELYAAVFGDSSYSAHDRPHVPYSGGQR